MAVALMLVTGGPIGCEGGGGGSRAVDIPPQRGGETQDDRGRRDRNARGQRPDRRLDEHGQMGTPRAQVGEGPGWSILLGTFTGENHREAAQQARDRLAERVPQFRETRVQHRAAGSVLVWGNWPRIDDPAAQAELRRVQAFVWEGARPFGGAMMVRTETTRSAVIGPHDLRQLRRQYPTVRSLQTLQVAVWADFDGSMTVEEIRRSAEAHTARLRAQGHEAWYHHDDHLMMSVVTVGAFDHTAYNPRSTLYSREVEELMRKFPFLLVNGDPLPIRLDPRNPRSRETLKPCFLVMVPN